MEDAIRLRSPGFDPARNAANRKCVVLLPALMDARVKPA